MRIVVSFPGIGYHCDKPLLYYSRKLAAGDEAVTLQYTYRKEGLRGNPAALEEAFEALYAQAEPELDAVSWQNYEEIVFLAKSIGTAVAAAYAARHGLQCRQVLYTPRELTCRFAPKDCLAFLGEADPWSDAAAVVRDWPGEIHLCPGNHSLETGDVLRDLETLRDVMARTKTYLA